MKRLAHSAAACCAAVASGIPKPSRISSKSPGSYRISVVMLLEKAVDVKPSFGMRETVERTVETGFAAAFRDAAEQAMATAR